MANLSDLVTGLSLVTGLPEATVFAYGRFARESGLIAQRGRRRGAASMRPEDAANLLIAVGGTAVTRESGEAIKIYRPMRGVIFDFEESVREMFLTWLKPLGIELIDQGEFGTRYALKADFGSFLEFLICEASRGELIRLMRRIPVAEVPGELWAEWKRTQSENLHLSLELLIERGLLKPKPTEQVLVREDLELVATFWRTGSPRIDVEFKRNWDHPQTVFQLTFDPVRTSRIRQGALRVSAQFTHDAVVALGLVLKDQVAPKSLTPRRLAVIYERQAFGSQGRVIGHE